MSTKELHRVILYGIYGNCCCNCINSVSRTLTPEALPTPSGGSSYCYRAGLVGVNTGRTIFRISQGGANCRVIHITIKSS